MKTKSFLTYIIVSVLLLALAPAGWAVNVIKQDTATLANPTDWSAMPGGNDVGEFDATISAGNAAALQLGGGLSIGGLQFDGTLHGAVTIGNTGGNTLTLNNAGTDLDLSAANTNVTINCLVGLGSSQTWNVAAGRTLTMGGAISDGGAGYGLTLAGNGTLNLNTTETYLGGTIVNGGILNLPGDGATGVIRNNLAINSGGTVSASTSWGLGYSTCVTNITITGGTLTFVGGNNNGGTSAQTITMTGGTISGNNYDWYNGLTSTPTLATVASSTTATISSGFRMRLNNNILTLNVAQGTVPNGVDLAISGNILSAFASDGINKTGAGTAVLSGANTYGGTTTVSSGKLVLSSAATGTGAITVNDNATLGVLAVGASQLKPTTLTEGSTSGPTTNEFTGVSSTTTAPILAGTLTLKGTTTIKIFSGPVFAGYVYPLIAFTTINGTGSFVLGSVPAGLTATIVTNGSTIALSVTATPYAAVAWNGNLNGTWDIANTANWLTNGVSGHTYLDNDPVLFDDTAAGTTMVSNTVAVAPGGITVNCTNLAYTLGGSPITSSLGLTKNGTNTLTLTGADTLGAIIINAGTVAIGGAGQWNGGTYSSAITDNGALNYNSSAAQTLAGVISGTGRLIQNSTNTLTLGNINTYTGGTTVNSGTLNLSGGAPTIRNNLIINSGAQVVASSSWYLGYDGLSTWVTNIVINGGTLTANGSGGTGTSAQNITLTAGTIAGTSLALYTGNPSVTFTVATLASSTSSVWSAPCQIRVGASGTLNFNVAQGTVPGGVDLLVSGLFSSGTGQTVVKSGNGVMQMTAANSYSYPTVISNGTLVVSSAQSGTGIITVNDNATLGVTVSGLSQLKPTTLTEGSSAGPTTNLFSGLSSTTTAPLKPTALTLKGTTTINILSGVFSAGQSYPLITYTTISGAGGFVLGTLPTGVVATVGTNASSIVLNVTVVPIPLDVWAGNVNGTWDIGTTANWKTNGVSVAYANGNLTLFDDTASGSTTISNEVTVSPASLTVTNMTKAYTFGGSAIAGATGLTKSGTNSLTLTSSNAFSGGTTINGGLVSFVTNGLGSGPVAFVGNATLQWAANNGQDKSSGLTIGSGVTATIDTGTNNVTFATALTGSSASLTKVGNGTLTLAGGNTYAGGTIVNGGALTVPGGGGSGAIMGNLTINGNGTVNTPTGWGLGYANGTCVNSISINGGTLNFTDSSDNGGTSASTITMNGGTISCGGFIDWYNGITSTPTLATTASSTTATIGASINLRLGNSHLTFNVASGTAPGGIDLLISGIIKGTGAGDGITKTGAGLLDLTAAETYTGPTTVSGGTLMIDSAGRLAAGSAVTVQTNATLIGVGTINGTVTVQNGGTLAVARVGDTNNGDIGTFYIQGALTLSAGSTSQFRISKNGGSTVADSVFLGTPGVTYGGTLVVTNITSDTNLLAAGDTFTLFSGGPWNGGFASVNLPSLPAGLVWDTSGLLTAGSIAVAASGSVVATTPTFSPVAGGYVGAQLVAINDTTPGGAVIHYTLDGSTPNNTSPVYTGPITVANNTNLTINAYATAAGYIDSAVGSATYQTEPEAVWVVPSGGSWTTAGNWTNNIVPNGSGITADFSTVTLGSDSIVTLDGATTIGNLIFGDGGTNFNWEVDTGSGGPLMLAGTTPSITVNNQMTTIQALLAGSSGLTKTGNGMLVVTTAPTLSGPVAVSGGTLTLTNCSIQTSTAVSVSSGAVLNLAGNVAGGFVMPGNWTIAGTVTASMGFNWPGTLTFNGGTYTGASGAIGMKGSPVDSFPIIANGTGNTISCASIGGYNAGGTASYTLALNTPLSGDTLAVSSTITDGNTSTVVNGVTKTGFGTVTLSGTNTYTGPTIVSNGTLVVSGSLGAGSPVYVAPAGTLAGTGSIGDIATVDGILAPGIGGPGTLTMSNTLTLNTGSQTVMEINRTSSTFDSVQMGLGSVTYGGTLTVTNVSLTPFTNGDSYPLFAATTYNGKFTTTNLPALASGIKWVWTPTNGTLSVVAVATVNPNPTNITTTVSGGNLNLAWPADHTGWRLLVQTNHLLAGISLNTNDWTTVAGSSVTNQMSIPIIITNQDEFYRLVYP